MIQHKEPSIPKASMNMEKIRETYPNAYQPWNEVSDQKLKEQFLGGTSIVDLAKISGRNRGAIRSRLIKLGLIERKSKFYKKPIQNLNENEIINKLETETEFVDKTQINLFTRLLLKFCPNLAMKMMARKMGIENPIFEPIHEVFSKIKRIELLPLQSGSRGFMLILDNKTALYFYQDGDHFVYDGFEMGEYEKGDVTIFDNLNNN